jgi:hypothetical protein
MVDADALNRKIDIRLRSLRERIAALALHGQAPTDRAALQAEWVDALDRCEWLHERFIAGGLTRDQAALHERNLTALAEQLATLRELDLPPPRGNVAAWLDAHPSSGRLAEPA